jgi:hypothetical protein
LCDLCEPGAFPGREIEHLCTFPPDTYDIQNPLSLLNPLAGSEISVIETAIAFKTPNNVNAVSAFLKGMKDVNDIHFSGAGHADNPDVSWILETH